MTGTPGAVDEVLAFVRRVNDAWTTDREPGALAGLFHERMVAYTAAARGRVEGRDACVAGWSRFAESCEIVEWNESDVDVRLFAGDRTAVITYAYEIAFRMGGHEYRETGRDMIVLVKEDDRWWLAADHYSSMPA